MADDPQTLVTQAQIGTMLRMRDDLNREIAGYQDVEAKLAFAQAKLAIVNDNLKTLGYVDPTPPPQNVQ